MSELGDIFEAQKKFKAGLDRYPDGLPARISALCTAMIHEAAELQRLTDWKWWKKPEPLEAGEDRPFFHGITCNTGYLNQ